MQIPEGWRGHGWRRFAENLVSLATLNVSTYLFPLILVPFLLAQLGQEGYSVVLFVQAVMAYLQGLTDFGFSQTGAKLIARDRDRTARVRQVFWMVVLTKLGLFVLAGGLIALIHARTDLLHYPGDLFVWGSLQVVGQALLVDWYFRGLNELRVISGFNLAVRALSFGFILALVRDPSDIIVVLQVNGLVSLGLGLGIFAWCLRRLGFARPRAHWWREDFSGLWYNGLTGLLNTISRHGHLVIMRQFLDVPVFAVYSVSYKIVMSAYSVLAALPQTIFSHMGDKVHDPPVFRRWLGRFLAANATIYTAAALALLLGAPLLARLLAVEEPVAAFVGVLRRQSVMLAAAGVTTVLSATFGVLTGRERTQFRTLLAANVAMVVYLAAAARGGVGLDIYAWTLPLIEVVWALLLLRVYAMWRRATAA